VSRRCGGANRVTVLIPRAAPLDARDGVERNPDSTSTATSASVAHAYRPPGLSVLQDRPALTAMPRSRASISKSKLKIMNR